MSYIYEGYENTGLEQAIEANPELHKFIRELNFSFGLKAFALTPKHLMYQSNDGISVCLCFANGLSAGRVWVGREVNQDGETKPVYCYYSQWYAKARGRTNNERKTLTSIKLSSLIATMKRNEVIPKADKQILVLRDTMREVRSSMLEAASKGRRNDKSVYDCDIEAYHAMLKVFVGHESQDVLLKFDRSKLKEALDKFNSVDKVKADRREFLMSKLYGGSLYAIGVCNDFGDYLVAKFSVTRDAKAAHYEDRLVVNLETMKRVRSLSESFSEFISFLTMLKVGKENLNNDDKVRNNDGWVFPRKSGYDENFDATYIRYQSYDNLTWIVLPCSAI